MTSRAQNAAASGLVLSVRMVTGGPILWAVYSPALDALLGRPEQLWHFLTRQAAEAYIRTDLDALEARAKDEEAQLCLS